MPLQRVVSTSTVMFFASLGRAERADGGIDDAAQVDRLAVEAELAEGDRGDVEDVFDQLRLRAGGAFDRLERRLVRFGIELAEAEHAHPAERGGHRRAQLVRDRGEELVLGVARLDGGAVELRVVDGDGRAARDQLGEVGIAWSNGPVARIRT